MRRGRLIQLVRSKFIQMPFPLSVMDHFFSHILCLPLFHFFACPKKVEQKKAAGPDSYRKLQAISGGNYYQRSTWHISNEYPPERTGRFAYA